MMNSAVGSPGYTDYYAQLDHQQSGQTLPRIYNLEIPPGTAPAPRDPGRRAHARHKPYAEESSLIYNYRRLWTYYIENVPYAMEKPANEDYNETYRQTFDGRTLKYTLTVLQQPERARACGAGARSSADRRPVDPPPVIELRVYEGQGLEPKDWTDITLKHNATFILCASLENARPIARGRLHTPTNIASLQGVNFAGTNYLERPKPAGYFIFPDLSVRNEGWYRLSFSLLEGTKEARDADPDRQFPPSPRSQTDGEPKAPPNFEDMATRLDVRSRPFQVFSAKKFPGLSESTELSRLVADQGCRVRIRRDVRMRKHGARKDDGDSYEGERRSMSRFPTPDTPYPPQTPMERPRTISRASMEGGQHGYDQYRRASGEMAFYGQGYPPSSMALASAGPSPIAAYPAPPGSSSATATPHPHVTYPQTVAPTPSNGFAVPQLRHAVDSLLPAYPAPESRACCYSLPNPATVPRSITPDMSRSSLLAPTISSLLNQPNGSASYDPIRKQYNMSTDAGPSKRAYSPNTVRTHFQPLKQGMRPDSLQTLSNPTFAGAMEPDTSPYNSDSEDGSGDSLPGSMKYKRANGSTGRKPIPMSTSNRQGRI